MVRNVIVASAFCVAMSAGSAPASARWLSSVADCPCCGLGCEMIEPVASLPRAHRSRERADAWALYPVRPYTRFDIEGVRVLERMR